MFVNRAVGEHISFYSTECYSCHLNFLTAAWRNNGEMLCMTCKNSSSMH